MTSEDLAADPTLETVAGYFARSVGRSYGRPVKDDYIRARAVIAASRRRTSEEIAAAIQRHRDQFEPGSVVETALYVAEEIARNIGKGDPNG